MRTVRMATGKARQQEKGRRAGDSGRGRYVRDHRREATNRKRHVLPCPTLHRRGPRVSWSFLEGRDCLPHPRFCGLGVASVGQRQDSSNGFTELLRQSRLCIGSMKGRQAAVSDFRVTSECNPCATLQRARRHRGRQVYDRHRTGCTWRSASIPKRSGRTGSGCPSVDKAAVGGVCRRLRLWGWRSGCACIPGPGDMALAMALVIDRRPNVAPLCWSGCRRQGLVQRAIF